MIAVGELLSAQNVGGSGFTESRSKNPELHKPARPHRRERLQRPPDRQHRADFLQAGRADFESRRNP